jgi:hypothetical protein
MRHAHNSICKRLLSLFYILKFSMVPGWQITREIPITFDHPPTMHAPSLPQQQGQCHEMFWPVRVHCTKSTLEPTVHCTLRIKTIVDLFKNNQKTHSCVRRSNLDPIISNTPFSRAYLRTCVYMLFCKKATASDPPPAPPSPHINETCCGNIFMLYPSRIIGL